MTKNIQNFRVWNIFHHFLGAYHRVIISNRLSLVHYLLFATLNLIYPVGWRNRIHRLHLYKVVRPPTNECPAYNSKQSDGEAPVMQKLWGRQSTPSLPSLPGSIWPGVVASDRVQSMDNRIKLSTNAKLYCLKYNCFCMLHWIAWNTCITVFVC